MQKEVSPAGVISVSTIRVIRLHRTRSSSVSDRPISTSSGSCSMLWSASISSDGADPASTALIDEQVFCIEHRSYMTHQCPNATQQDVMVIICPLCAKGVRLIPNQDPNITWDIHVNAECDPSNYQKATKKKRCPVPGCKDFLTFSNSIRCRDCNREHCLKHRFGPDHKCPGPKKPDSGFPFIAMLRKSQKGMSAAPSQTSPDGGPSWWSSSSLLNAASSVRASAETGMQRLSIATNQALQKARDGMAQSSGSKGNGSGSKGEQGGQQTNSLVSRATVDVCPNCSRAFRDPVLLVEHFERDHTGTSKA